MPKQRWVRRLAAGVIAVLLLLVVLTGLTLAISPGVGDLKQRVAARLAAHGADSDNGVVPAKLAAALIATEDSRFYSNPGLDPAGVLRFAESKGTDGAATLEQQLAKEIYTPDDSFLDKVKDVGIAIKMDQDYSKAEILALYFDTAYFGDGAYGIVDASEHYFGRSAADLTWAQASMLAGLVQAPSDYDPHGHLTLARSRQSHVLARLVATGHLTQAESDQVFASPLDPAVSFYG